VLAGPIAIAPQSFRVIVGIHPQSIILDS